VQRYSNEASLFRIFPTLYVGDAAINKPSRTLESRIDQPNCNEYHRSYVAHSVTRNRSKELILRISEIDDSGASVPNTTRASTARRDVYREGPRLPTPHIPLSESQNQRQRNRKKRRHISCLCVSSTRRQPPSYHHDILSQKSSTPAG